MTDKPVKPFRKSLGKNEENELTGEFIEGDVLFELCNCGHEREKHNNNFQECSMCDCIRFTRSNVC